MSKGDGSTLTPPGGSAAPQPERAALRADEDAAAVLVVLASLQSPPAAVPAGPRSAWGDPAHRLRVSGPGGAGWWISGLPG